MYALMSSSRARKQSSSPSPRPSTTAQVVNNKHHASKAMVGPNLNSGGPGLGGTGEGKCSRDPTPRQLGHAANILLFQLVVGPQTFTVFHCYTLLLRCGLHTFLV